MRCLAFGVSWVFILAVLAGYSPSVFCHPSFMGADIEELTGVIELSITNSAGTYGSYWISPEDLETGTLRLHKISSRRDGEKTMVQVLVPSSDGGDQWVVTERWSRPVRGGYTYIGIKPENPIVYVFRQDLALKIWKRLRDVIEPALAADPGMVDRALEAPIDLTRLKSEKCSDSTRNPK